MGSESDKRWGATGRKDAPTCAPESLFIVGLDGKGDSEEERVAWFKSRFAGREAWLDTIDGLRDERATSPIPEGFIRSCMLGVVEPVVIIVSPPDCDGKVYACVDAGRQRTRALREVNIRRKGQGLPPLEIDTAKKKVNDGLMARTFNVVSNTRVEASALWRARRALELSESGVSLEEVANYVGLTSVQGVRDLLALLDCSDKVKAALDAGTITQSAAKELAKLPAAKQDERLEKLLATRAKGRAAKEIAKGHDATAKPKRFQPKATIEKVLKTLGAATRSTMSNPFEVDAGTAILRWASGDDAALDATPEWFQQAVSSATAKKEKEIEVAVVTCPDDCAVEEHGHDHEILGGGEPSHGDNPGVEQHADESTGDGAIKEAA